MKPCEVHMPDHSEIARWEKTCSDLAIRQFLQKTF